MPRATDSVDSIYTGTKYSNWLYIGDATEVGLQLTWTGDAAATLTLQGTHAHRTTDGKGADLADASLDIDDVSSTFNATIAGTAGTDTDNWLDVGVRHVRVKFAGTGGSSGNATLIWSIKD